MRKKKNYVIGFLVGVALIIGGTVGINSAFDVFSDFYYLTSFRRLPPVSEDYYGERKYKSALVYHLGPGSIQSAILGSSRVASLNPLDSQLSKDGAPVYNLAFAGATVDQLLAFATQLVALHPDAQVFLGLDFRGFSVRSPDLLYLQGPYHLPSAWDAFQRLIAGETVRQTMIWLAKSTRVRFSWVGVRPIPGAGQTADRLAEMAGKMKGANLELAGYTYDSSAVDKVKSFALRHPNVTVFLTPVSAWYIDVLRAYGLQDAFVAWRKAFTTLPNCLDFSYNPAFSAIPQTFIDPHHVTPAVGKVLLDDLAKARRKENLSWGTLCADPARHWAP